MKRILLLAIGLVLLLMCAGTVSANLVLNDGFESPVAGSPFASLSMGNGLTDWSIDSGSIDLIHGNWQPHSGAQSIDLAGSAPGKISQTINTETGKTYELKFWLAGNPSAPAQGVKGLNVYWDGSEIKTATFDTTGKSKDNMGWTLVTITGLKATKTTTEIAFGQGQTSDPRVGVALDDISVEKEDPITPTPEFPSMALPATMLVGFIGIVLYVQKSNKE